MSIEFVTSIKDYKFSKFPVKTVNILKEFLQDSVFFERIGVTKIPVPVKNIETRVYRRLI